MNRLRYLFLIGGVAAGTLLGQEPSKEKDRKEHKQGGAITGCLTPATGQNQQDFVLTEEGTNRRITLTGQDLSKHANHKVRVTGDQVSGQTDRMTVTKVEHISDSCGSPR
jgi:hypothetical protein